MVDTVDFTELLDLAKQASGATSDSDLSRKLGVSRQSVSNWRNSNKFPDTITCATIAGITGVPLAKVLGIVGEARATDQEEKAVWRKLAATAMALLVGVGFAYFQGDAGVALAAMAPLAVTDPLYIMRNSLSAVSAGSGFGSALTYHRALLRIRGKLGYERHL